MSHIGVCVHTSKNNEFFNKDKKYFPDWEFFQHTSVNSKISGKRNFLKKEKKDYGFSFSSISCRTIFIYSSQEGAARQAGIRSVGYGKKIIHHKYHEYGKRIFRKDSSFSRRFPICTWNHTLRGKSQAVCRYTFRCRVQGSRQCSASRGTAMCS